MSVLYQNFFQLPISDLIESFLFLSLPENSPDFISLFCPFLFKFAQMIPPSDFDTLPV